MDAKTVEIIKTKLRAGSQRYLEDLDEKRYECSGAVESILHHIESGDDIRAFMDITKLVGLTARPVQPDLTPLLSVLALIAIETFERSES